MERVATYTAELQAQQDTLEHAESTARDEILRFQRLFLALPNAVVSVDRGGLIVEANPASARLLGHPVPELSRQHFLRFVAPSQRKRIEAALTQDTTETVLIDTELLIDRDRRSVALHLLSLPPVDARSPEVLCAIEDHSTERRLLQTLAHQVEHDALTDLLSRTAFMAALGRLVTRGGQTTGVLFIDVDRFKWVNDTHGHGAGDRALQAIAAALRHQVRVSDLVARVSGDEFAIALPEVPDIQVVTRAAANLVEAMRDGLVVGGVRLPISLSVGVAMSRGTQDTADDLVKRADAAMYRAKDAGRATWRLFDRDLESEMDQFYTVREAIRAALEEDRLRLCAQPIRRLDDGSMVGRELLLRIEAPDGSLRLPAHFLDIARTSRTLRDLGRWVRREALALVASEADPSDPLFTTLNVSPAELDLALAHDLIDLHRSFALPTGRVVVEITEEVMLPGAGEAREALDQIAKAGIPIALDDFGSGYASLVHLSELPLAWVKLDGALVADHANGDGRVLRAILELCRALDLVVIAEGIENEAQHQLLRTMGCPLGQGWHLGRPTLLARV